jgi:SAM-dependent methyltransferase
MNRGNAPAIRERVCDGLVGDVLEIGFGAGLNLPYLPAAVTGVWAVEPSATGRSLSRKRRDGSTVPVVFECDDAMALPFPDDRFDSALSTWTLCTVPDPVTALREVRRVLRPGATLHFVEHGLAPDAGVVRWQRRLNPVQRRLAGGCHLDRDIAGLVRAAGFELTAMSTYYERTAPKVLGSMYEGRAAAA